MKTHRSGIVTVGALLTVIAVGSAIGSGDRNSTRGREVTLTGRVVDLHGFITETYASEDRVKCTQDCIRSGVPAGLETEDGLIIIGEGTKGPARTIATLAMKNVELKGKLYERHGVRYIDITSAIEVQGEESEHSWPVNEEDEGGDDDDGGGNDE